MQRAVPEELLLGDIVGGGHLAEDTSGHEQQYGDNIGYGLID